MTRKPKGIQTTLLGSAALLAAGTAVESALAATEAPDAAPPPHASQQAGVAVTRSQVTVTRTGVVIKNPALAAALRKDRAKTVRALAEKYPGLSSRQVTIGKSGEVTIASSAVRRAVDSDTHLNIICGYGCGSTGFVEKSQPASRR